MDCFSTDEILRLLQAAKDHRKDAWLLLTITFLHGLRSSEAVGLTPDNVVGHTLTVKRCKRSRPVRHELVEHENPLLDERKALLELVRKTPRNQKLFPITERTFQRWVHKYGKAAGLSEIASHPHTLKHSILTHLSETMKIPELQDYSGHKSMGSLGIYLHPKPEQVRSAVRKALGGIVSN